MANEEQTQQDQQEEKKSNGSMMQLVIVLVVALIAGAAGGFLTVKMLGGNSSNTSAQKPAEKPKTVEPITFTYAQSGSMQPFPLKDGTTLIADSVVFKLGSQECFDKFSNNRDTIADVLQSVFLSKGKYDLLSDSGLELAKIQIKNALNDRFGFIGDKEGEGVLNVIIIIKGFAG
jgi:flagellar FliL protein